ncbi:MAG: epimerase [Saprospiraceae bacterium]|nr:epimerase [Saprospiraceae bacterium]
MKLNVIITGTTGMVGKGVLLECIDSPDVESILLINRSPVDVMHPKVKEIIHKDFFDLSSVRDQLTGYNACFFCLGVSSVGMKEADYKRFTYDLTLGFAKVVLFLNPDMTFCYVSGAGTDSSEKGKSMWARVKGKTENDLLSLGFKATYMFRPGYIHPMRGIKSKTPLYNAFYVVLKPLYPLLKRMPKYVTDNAAIGRAMIAVARNGYTKRVLESIDINSIR